jgi:lysophospholipase L1-like esterase
LLRRIAVGLSLLVLFAAGGVAAFLWWFNQATGNPAFFESEIISFEQSDAHSPPPSGTVVFVGSSSIRLWKGLEEDMAPLQVLNRGFGGAQMEHLVFNADRIVSRYEPRAVVVYAGDNDLSAGTGRRARDVEKDYQQLVARLRRSQPTLPIYFLSIKHSLLRQDRWGEMSEANSRIERYSAADPELHYLDLSTVHLGSDGLPDARYFLIDGLHLSRAGYEAWAAAIRPLLLADLGTPEP